ncbi:hypothetical protein Nepgr_007683 [Nepenthes gracilis]|uniref:Regulatory protein RecX n=1 Tax=Nepenthes gracilis TaxID=150966 RepID=A0AAD3S7I5_NEPGR|nr:hypothetical protein Nepgr_007683 [Nepenthes gracilis]
MSIVGGSLIHKISFNLQRGFVLLPWLKKSDAAKCATNRSCSSSFPVRYIPNKSREVAGLEVSSGITASKDRIIGGSSSKMFGYENLNVREGSHSSTILGKKSEIETQKSMSNLSVDAKSESNEDIDYDVGVLDNEFTEVPEEVNEELEIHNGSSEDEEHESQSRGIKQGVEKLAVELLATRAFTAVELRKKLNAKHFPHNIVDGVIHDFLSRGLINDFLYAEAFSRSRWSSSSWGPRRIKQALLKKGVSHSDVEKAVKLVFEDGKGCGQDSRIGVSVSLMEQLYVQVSKQWLRSQNAPNETRKARIVRWLQYRGFDWGVVSVILKKLESQYPP